MRKVFYTGGYSVAMLSTVGVLGPKGTNSEQAAVEWSRREVPNGIRLIRYSTIADVLKGVARRAAKFGVVPVEDSRTGPVRTTAVELAKSCEKGDVRIIRECEMPFTHALACKGTPAKIRWVASHPQVLDICGNKLRRKLPRAEFLPTRSTVEAAQKAAADSTIAAVISERTAEEYGLKVHVPVVGRNSTRFFAVARNRIPPPTGYDKTSIAVNLIEDREGALYEILGEFARRKINLTRIESVPDSGKIGSYFFYIDMEGHIQDAPVREAIAGVERKAGVIFMGSYPRAPEKILPTAPVFKPPISAKPLTEASDEEILYGAV